MLLDALKAPVSTLIWCWPATVSLGIILESELNDKINWLSTLADSYYQRLRMDRHAADHQYRRFRSGTEKPRRNHRSAIAKVGRLFIITIGVLTIMQAFGLSLSGLLTFGGGWLNRRSCCKDLLSNFFGGLMIYFDRPFKVGDWIRSPDRQIEGTVERIGWRMTSIRTFDKRPLYVPNSVFSNIVVENPSRMLNRRIYEVVGLRYDDADKVPEIITAVREMLKNHKDIDTRQTLIVNFDTFGPSSLNFIYTHENRELGEIPRSETRRLIESRRHH